MSRQGTAGGADHEMFRECDGMETDDSTQREAERRARELLPFLLAKFSKRDDDEIVADLIAYGEECRKRGWEQCREAAARFIERPGWVMPLAPMQRAKDACAGRARSLEYTQDTPQGTTKEDQC